MGDETGSAMLRSHFYALPHKRTCQHLILAYLALRGGRHNAKDIAAHIRFSLGTVRTNAAGLAECGFVRKQTVHNPHRGGVEYEYSLTSTGLAVLRHISRKKKEGKR